MRVTVITDHRMLRAPDGGVWTETIFPNSFYQRYLSVFDEVRVLGRVKPSERQPEKGYRVDGDGVAVLDIPFYMGPRDYLRKRRAVWQAFNDLYDDESAYILRIPGQQLAANQHAILQKHSHPYAAEVVADAWDNYGVGSQKHPLRPLIQQVAHRQQIAQCHDAVATGYVTQKAIQRRYPPRSGAFRTHYSSIELKPEALVLTPKTFDKAPDPLKLICVGTLNQLYKGQDVLVEAVALLVARGVNVTATLVGDGSYRPFVEDLARKRGVFDRTTFVGSLPGGAPIREQLDRHDVYVLPSRQEGLPRSMIEAMARALPCVGSDRGGIPELLDVTDILPVDDAGALANRLADLASDPVQLTKLSAQNLAKAAAFEDVALKPRRDAMYAELLRVTNEWRDGRCR